jgi:hypothetical protein
MHLNIEPKSSPQTPGLPKGLEKRIRSLLAGGRWHPRCLIENELKKYGVTLATAGNALCLAESDYGGWLCIPTLRTPLEAPDEALAASGDVSPRCVVMQTLKTWRLEHGSPAAKRGPSPRKKTAKRKPAKTG